MGRLLMESINNLFHHAIDKLHEKYGSWRKLSYAFDMEISTIYKWRKGINDPNVITKLGLIAFAEVKGCIEQNTLKELLNEMGSEHTERVSCN